MRIAHTLSSALLRPNGIVRYINMVMAYQREQGHTTILVTDAEPTEQILADEIYWQGFENAARYQADIVNGVPHLQIDFNVIQNLRQVWHSVPACDFVIAHDLLSIRGAQDQRPGMFVQHESDILNGTRYSYMSDLWLQAHRRTVETTDWIIGEVVDRITPHAGRSMYAPVLFSRHALERSKTRPLLYIGDASERKGAREFMARARRLNLRPTVITHANDDVFRGAEVFEFGLQDQQAMFEVMATCRVAYIPSRSECLSIAVLECLQYMPVILDSQYAWTQYSRSTGVTLATGGDIDAKILWWQDPEHLYSTFPLDRWCINAERAWRTIEHEHVRSLLSA